MQASQAGEAVKEGLVKAEEAMWQAIKDLGESASAGATCIKVRFVLYCTAANHWLAGRGGCFAPAYWSHVPYAHPSTNQPQSWLPCSTNGDKPCCAAATCKAVFGGKATLCIPSNDDAAKPRFYRL
jgi:hypothetical protein